MKEEVRQGQEGITSKVTTRKILKICSAEGTAPVKCIMARISIS
jgi:hypothetical protein